MEKKKPTYEELERRCRELEAQTASAADNQGHERYLAAILETTQDGFFAINTDGMMIDVNEAYCRMSGYTREELLKLNINDIDADESPEDTAARLKRIFETGREAFETRHRRRDGSVFDIEVSVSYYPEKFPLLICFCRDISERKHAEEKLRYTSERLRAVMEYSPLLISEISPDGRYLQANQAVARFFNQTASNLTGRSFNELLPENTYDLFMKRITHVTETRQPLSVEDHFAMPDGDRHYLTTVYPLFDNAGNVRSIGSIAHDITIRVQAEEKLHLMARMLDEAPDSITIHDADGRFLYANRKTFALHGYDEDEFMAVNLHDLDVPESEALIIERFRQIEENGEATFEAAHYRKDGSCFPLSVHTKSIEWHGKPAVLSIATDITERKKAEDALSRSEERFRLFAELAPVGIVISDKNEKTLYVSPAFVNMFGYTIDDMPSVNEWWPLAYPDMAMREKVRREWHSLMSAVRESNADVNPVEYPVTCKDGSLRYIEFRISAADDLNIIIFSDITERKKAEDALRESEGKYRTLVDNAEEGILVAQDGMMKFANHYLAVMLDGYTGKELTSLPFSTFIHPDDREMVVEYHTRRLNGESVPSRYTFRAVTRKGVVRWVEISSVLIEWNGRPASLHFLVDITERKKTEDALRESEQRFRSFIENVNDIVYTLSPEGIFTYISPNWLDFVGKPADEAIGESFERYVHHDDVRLCREFLGKVLDTGEKQSAVEYRVKHADGSWRWHVSNGAPLRDADGSVTSYIGIARDVTARKQAEMELHKQSEAMEASIDGMAILDQNEIYTYVNTAHADVYGYSNPGELLGKSWRILYDADELERFEREIMPEFSRNGKWSGEAAGKKKDGSLFPQDISLTALQGGGLICLVRDTTERKAAEKQLKKTHDLLTNLARLVPGVIYQYRLYPDGRSAFPYSSPGMYSIYEVTPEEVREDATPVFGRLHPEDSNRVSESIFESARTLATFYCEFRVVLPKQGLRWRWSQAHPERTEDGGTLWHGIISDITDRKLAEIELQRQKNLLQKVFDVLPVGLWFTDKNGKLLSGNAAGIKIWGAEPLVDPSEYGVFKARRLPSGEEIAPEDWALAHTIREGVTIVDELLEIDAFDGKKRVILNSTAPVLDEQGEIQGAIVVNQDITDYQKLQEQLVQSQKMESVGRLAGGVAHDFNNMLAVVLGNVQFAMEQTDPSLPLHGDLVEIKKAAERSVTLTRQLLAFARKQTVEPEILDLNEKVTGMINMLKRLIGEDIDLIWKPAKTLPHIYIDPSQIDQILANLCVNARDAIKDVGTVIIESGSVIFDDEYCAEHEGFTPGEYVMLSVSDDGSGMDKDIISNIFDPFFTTKEQGKGTGLGLATVYGIVKQNNGFINVYSEKRHGTTLKVYLPRHYTESQEFESQTPPKKVYTGTETILLVEDEPQLLALSNKFLKKLGYEAITANSPAEAVRIAGDYPGRIHLLITDIVMPEMNGRDLAKRLRASHPDMKFLFMSGYTADVIAHHGVLEDGVQFIQKPFSLHDFSVKIKEALKEE